jgi:hypothetical protein
MGAPGYGSRMLRVARHTNQLEAEKSFDRDRVGFPELGAFVDHDGYDGVFLAVPGRGTHLERTSGASHRAPEPHPESLLVLFLQSTAMAERIYAAVGFRDLGLILEYEP